jgi:hypothetical protein
MITDIETEERLIIEIIKSSICNKSKRKVHREYDVSTDTLVTLRVNTPRIWNDLEPLLKKWVSATEIDEGESEHTAREKYARAEDLGEVIHHYLEVNPRLIDPISTLSKLKAEDEEHDRPPIHTPRSSGHAGRNSHSDGPRFGGADSDFGQRGLCAGGAWHRRKV